MEIRPDKIKGKKVFIISLILIVSISLVIHFTGYKSHRSLLDNFYLALAIIAGALFVFMAYGLYHGIEIVDDNPEFKKKKKSFSKGLRVYFDLASDMLFSIDNPLVAILAWIVVSILFVVFLVFLEALIWISILFVLPGLYWLFFNAYKMVFKRSHMTKGDWYKSIIYSIGFTLLYTGWIYGVVYFAELFKTW